MEIINASLEDDALEESTFWYFWSTVSVGGSRFVHIDANGYFGYLETHT